MSNRKIVTNEILITRLLKDCDMIDFAILRERLVHISKVSKKSITDDPAKWYNPIIGVQTYTRFFDKVENTIGFDRNNDTYEEQAVCSQTQALESARLAIEEATDILHYEDGEPVTAVTSEDIARIYSALVTVLVQIEEAQSLAV